MPTEAELQSALRRVVEYTEAMGNTVQGEAEGQTDDGRAIEGYQIQHGDHSLAVVTAPGWDYFNVTYQVDLVRQLAVQRAVSETSQSAQSGQVSVELEQRDLQRAADRLAEETDSMDRRGVRVGFARAVAQVTGEGAVNVQNDGDLVTGFQINTKFFPYRDGFDLEEYATKVQRTVTAGWVANEYLVDAYGLDGLGERELSSESPGGDMFQ
ncbi:MAG: hypothetical protein ABEJ92_12285 [Halobacteriales archaeon]